MVITLLAKGAAMRAAALVLALVTAFGSALADENPQLESLRKSLVLQEQRHDEEVAALKGMIAGEKKRLAFLEAGAVRKNGRLLVEYPPRGTNRQAMFTGVAEKNRHVGDCREAIAKLQAKADTLFTPVLPGLKHPCKPGDIGVVRSVSVIQVTGKDNAIVRDFYVTPRVVVEGGIPIDRGQVNQVVVMLRGVDMAGVVDDGGLTLDRLMEAVGTETYASADGGSRTVIVLRPVDPERLK